MRVYYIINWGKFIYIYKLRRLNFEMNIEMEGAEVRKERVCSFRSIDAMAINAHSHMLACIVL